MKKHLVLAINCKLLKHSLKVLLVISLKKIPIDVNMRSVVCVLYWTFQILSGEFPFSGFGYELLAVDINNDG